MANRKITELTALTGANATDTDVFAIVDVSADETKKMTLGELKEAFDSGSGFVRITGDTMTGDLALSGADVTFGDNDKAIFGGATSELQIYSDGSNSIIHDDGTGDLQIQANNLRFTNQSTSRTYAEFINAGSATLYHDNSPKLATTSTGIDVTGTVTADGLTVQTVQGNIEIANSSAIIDMQRAGTNYIYASDASGNLRLGSGGLFNRINIANSGDISFYEDTGTTPKFFWDASAESLGIGTSSPAQALDVVGTALLGENRTNATAKTARLGAAHYTTSEEPLALIVGSSSASDNTVTIGGGTSQFNASTSVRFFTAANTTTTSGTERMRIDSSGNVGIGVSDPSTWSLGKALHIGAKENNLWGEADYAFHMNQNAYYNGGWKYTHTDQATQYTQSDGQHFWSYAGSGTADTALSWSEAMRIDSSGRVGIGTTSTNYPLTVDGYIGVRSGNGITFLNPSNNYTSDIYNGASSGTSDLRFKTQAAERMRISSSGNVGIGTSSPAYNFELSNTAGDANLGITASASGLSQLLFTDGSIAGKIAYRHPTNSMEFNVNGSERMRIDSSGTLTTPSGVDFNIMSASGMTLGSTTSITIFKTNNSERMRITSSGDILVGKTSSNNNTAGVEFGATGYGIFTRDANKVAIFNRKTSDGVILDIQKDGSRVGSIGSISGAVSYIVLDPRTNGSGIRGSTASILPTNNAGANLDATIELGSDSNRFKDLYLSGGVYLGGTGSANHLDDYEEGTWLVEMFDASTGGNQSASTATGYYTKIGRMVHITFSKYNLSNAGMTGSGAVWISLPFTPTGEVVAGSVNLRQFSFPATVEYLVPQPAVGVGRFVIQMVRSGNTSTEVTWANISNTITDIGSLSITYMA